jgi:hypothetical protein
VRTPSVEGSKVKKTYRAHPKLVEFLLVFHGFEAFALLAKDAVFLLQSAC